MNVFGFAVMLVFTFGLVEVVNRFQSQLTWAINCAFETFSLDIQRQYS